MATGPSKSVGRQPDTQSEYRTWDRADVGGACEGEQCVCIPRSPQTYRHRRTDTDECGHTHRHAQISQLTSALVLRGSAGAAAAPATTIPELGTPHRVAHYPSSVLQTA
eukprot:9528-Rhodomonas_salina.1